jgi:ParB-like chromosome segregation protein Spo0J
MSRERIKQLLVDFLDLEKLPKLTEKESARHPVKVDDVEAAKRAGIEEVPCFVRDDLSEEEAYMVLATANAQGELSPLEIGMHALHYVEKASGGRGKKGGLSEYAEKVGKKRQNVESYRDAAEVTKNLHNDVQVSSLLNKAAHLAAIRKLPEEIWTKARRAFDT